MRRVERGEGGGRASPSSHALRHEQRDAGAAACQQAGHESQKLCELRPRRRLVPRALRRAATQSQQYRVLGPLVRAPASTEVRSQDLGVA